MEGIHTCSSSLSCDISLFAISECGSRCCEGMKQTKNEIKMEFYVASKRGVMFVDYEWK